MASTRDGAYKFELFEAQQAAMPAPKKQEVPIGPQRVVKEQRTKAEIHAEAVAINKRLAKIFIVSVCFVSFIGINMSARAKLTWTALQIASVQSQIDEENSRTVDLKSKLTQKMSTEAVEDYAVNRLGMIKANRSQINYISMNSGDYVLYSDNVGEDSGE